MTGLACFRGEDGKKEQSYFLYRLPAAWLPHILFPVGHLQKPEVWKRAEELDLPADEMKESQEICFVTQGDYRTFLTEEAPQALRPGPFLDPEGRKIGEHRGIAFYTPGQRKGLGIALGERLYVKEVNPETNAVRPGAGRRPVPANLHGSGCELVGRRRARNPGARGHQIPVCLAGSLRPG